jgi:hypothetical protein
LIRRTLKGPESWFGLEAEEVRLALGEDWR